MTDWPERIRSTRERLGLSQAKLARALGVTERAVQMWEAGDRTPPDFLLLALERLESAD